MSTNELAIKVHLSCFQRMNRWIVEGENFTQKQILIQKPIQLHKVRYKIHNFNTVAIRLYAATLTLMFLGKVY